MFTRFKTIEADSSETIFEVFLLQKEKHCGNFLHSTPSKKKIMFFSLDRPITKNQTPSRGFFAVVTIQKEKRAALLLFFTF